MEEDKDFDTEDWYPPANTEIVDDTWEPGEGRMLYSMPAIAEHVYDEKLKRIVEKDYQNEQK